MSSELLFDACKADTAFEAIPIIDISGATNPDPAARRRLASEIRDACIRVGFFYIKDHSIPSSLPQRVISSSLPFFALPEEEKLKYDIRKSASFKGYNSLLSGNIDPEGQGDLHEGFNIGWEALEGHESQTKANAWYDQNSTMGGANVWPEGGEDMKEFRRTMLEYYHAAVNLGLKLFPLLALALDLPEDFFADKTTRPAAIMRILHYPPQTGPVDDRVIGIGAHTDYEVFTILYQQDDIQTLQVLNSAGKWINAPPTPQTLVVNLGDQLARWTNDVFKSTVHRAINRTGLERYSIPLFFGTDYDVLLEPLPSCVSESRPSKYEPITAGQFVQSRLEASYMMSKA